MHVAQAKTYPVYTDSSQARKDASDPKGRDVRTGVVIRLDAHRRNRDGGETFAETTSTEAENRRDVPAGRFGIRLGDLIGYWLDRFLHPERRPLVLKIDGKKYRTVDWSLGGFRINGFHESGKPRDEVSGTIGGGGMRRGEFVAEILRVSASGEVRMRLLEVTPATFLAMAAVKSC